MNFSFIETRLQETGLSLILIYTGAIMAKHRISTEIESNNYCCYGCGNKVRFLSPGGKEMCESSSNKCPVNRKKNSNSIKIAHKDGRIPGWNQIENLNRGWAKGLTKETDARVARPQFIGRRFGASLSGHTEETKQKLSIKRTEYLEKSPHIKWKQLPNGIKVQGDWEYNVGCILLEQGFELSRTKIIFDGHRRYTPDFHIKENVFVEVKGWLSERDKQKYIKVLTEHKNIKIFLIRNEFGINNYSKFIDKQITLEECEDLRTVLGC